MGNTASLVAGRRTESQSQIIIEPKAERQTSRVVPEKLHPIVCSEGGLVVLMQALNTSCDQALQFRVTKLAS
jgi:hypothetical protein